MFIRVKLIGVFIREMRVINFYYFYAYNTYQMHWGAYIGFILVVAKG